MHGPSLGGAKCGPQFSTGPRQGFLPLWVPSLVLPEPVLLTFPLAADARGGSHTFPRCHPGCKWWPATLPGPGMPPRKLLPRATAGIVTQAGQPRGLASCGAELTSGIRAPKTRPKTLEAHPSGAESLQRSWHQTTYSLGDHNHKGWSWRAPSLPCVSPRGAAAAGRHHHVTRACAWLAGRGPPAWTPHATLRWESSTHRGRRSCTTRGLWRVGTAGSPLASRTPPPTPGPEVRAHPLQESWGRAGLLGNWARGSPAHAGAAPSYRPQRRLPSEGPAATSLLAPQEIQKPESWGPEAGDPFPGPTNNCSPSKGRSGE